MKKINLFIPYLFFTFTNLNAQIETPDFNKYDLKGKVKSIELIKFEAVDYFGELKKVKVRSNTILNYDTNYRVNNIKEIENGIETFYEIIRNETLESKVFKIIKNKNTIGLDEFKYDNKANLIEYYSYEMDTLKRKKIATYDNDNRIIEYKEYNNRGSIDYKRNWKYDLRNKLIELEDYRYGYYNKKQFKYNNGILYQTIILNENGAIKSKINHTYHKNGKIKEEIEIFIDSNEFSKIIRTYNSNGNILSSLKYDSNNNIVGKENTQYDANGNIISEEGSWGKQLWEFDKNNYLIKMENKYKISTSQTSKEVTKKITTYENDKFGNPIKIIETFFYNNSILESAEKLVEERIISYRQ